MGASVMAHSEKVIRVKPAAVATEPDDG
jgi:hypothetical protein